MTWEEYQAKFAQDEFCIFSFNAVVSEFDSEGNLKKTASYSALIDPWDYPINRDYTYNLSVDNGYYQGVNIGPSTRQYNLEIYVPGNDLTHIPTGRIIDIDYLD